MERRCVERPAPAAAAAGGRGRAAARRSRRRRSSRSSGRSAPALVLVFAAEGELLAPLTGRLREALRAGLPGDRLLVGRRLRLRRLPRRPGGGDRLPGGGLPRRGGLAARPAPAHGARLDPALRRLSAGFVGAAPGWARFGLLMIDGLCRREEVVVATVDAALGDLPVLGGSAGDGLRFGRTHLALDGESHPESAIFCLVASAFPVEEVIFDHFTPAERPDGGDRGAARGAGDPLDQRRAGGRGVCAADRRAGGGARAARLRRAPAADAPGRAARGPGDPGGDARAAASA